MDEHKEAAPTTCPQCNAALEVHFGYITWCPHCDWNVQPLKSPRPTTLMGALYADLGNRWGRRLYDDLQRAPSLQPALTPSYAMAVLCAALVHLVTVLCAVLGIVMIVQNWHNPFLDLLGAFLIVIAWTMRPRLAPFPERSLSRQRFPTLYAVVDAVAAKMKARPVTAIVLTSDFNASYQRAGWRRRQVLSLGLPLLTVLDERETAALIAHEIAHGVNGDATAGLFIGSAVNTLVRWYVLLYPTPTRYAGHGIGAMAIVISKPILLLAAQIPRLGAVALSHLLWRDSQRAEYLADHLAAQVTGTAALLSLLDKLFLRDTYALVVQRAGVANEHENLFATLRHRCETLPAAERARLHRVARLEDSRLDATHPPSGLRIALLEARPIQQPALNLSALQWRSLHDELAATEGAMQQRLVDAYRSRLYY